MTTDLFNIPAPIDVTALDVTERWVIGGLLAAGRGLATEVLATLRPADLESPALGAVLTVLDLTVRAGIPHTSANLTAMAVQQGMLDAGQQQYFHRLLTDLLEQGMGEPGCWQSPRLIYRAALRSLLALDGRAAQIRETYNLEDGWFFGHDAIESAARAINGAGILADDLDQLASELTASAVRLRQEVAA